jgi:cell division septum initiation protein DivIVA
MEGNQESIAPQFATVVRGYDRMQVDDYVEHLNQWVEQADLRAQQCESVAARATAEVEELRHRLASADAGALTATPESMKALGDRVGSIMQSSFQAAKELHGQAEDTARTRVAAAEETANRIVGEATARADELSRAAEDLFRQAQEALASANDAVAQQLDAAKARGTAEREDMLQRARQEMRELARQGAAEERSRREHIDALEEHRRRIMEEIGLLHQRLGSIGDGLSAPSRAPAPPAPEKAPASEPSDDETLVLEMPEPTPKPQPQGQGRRKVASSSAR